MGVHVLPTFNGYTVDTRLREFRKADYGKGLEFISFDSPEGKKLLQEMEAFIDTVNREKKNGAGD